MTPAELSSSADYPANLRSFTRQRQDRMYIPLQKSKPNFINPADFIAGLILILCFIAAFVLPGVIVRVFG